MMRYITSFLAATMGFAHLAQSAPAADTMTNNQVIVGHNATYTLVDLNWNVKIRNTATPYNVTATGTVEDALAKMAVYDPAGAAAINASVQSNDTASNFELLTQPNEDYIATDRFCNIGGGRASSYRIKQGIEYLGTVPGSPGQGPGPGSCGRVSCSYGAAIYWCNDNLESKTLEAYWAIADGAQLLLDYCQTTNNGGVNGQQFYQDGWNVIVRYDFC